MEKGFLTALERVGLVRKDLQFVDSISGAQGRELFCQVHRTSSGKALAFRPGSAASP